MYTGRESVAEYNVLQHNLPQTRNTALGTGAGRSTCLSEIGGKTLSCTNASPRSARSGAVQSTALCSSLLLYIERKHIRMGTVPGKQCVTLMYCSCKRIRIHMIASTSWISIALHIRSTGQLTSSKLLAPETCII